MLIHLMVFYKLKTNKTPGEDLINDELFKYSSQKFIQRFLSLLWEDKKSQKIGQKQL